MHKIIEKKDVIKKIQRKTGYKKVEVEKVINEFIHLVEESLVDLDSVRLFGFGTFKMKEKLPKPGRNIVSGEPLYIPRKIVPVFEAGDNLKRKVTKIYDSEDLWEK